MTKKRVFWSVLLTLLVVLCMGFVGCDKKKPETPKTEPPAAVNAATISYDGAIIKWETVSGANSYALTINGQSYTSYNNGQYQFPYSNLAADNYVIGITAMNNYGSSAAVTRTFQKLAAPENILFDQTGEMSWSAVLGASSYIVEVNNAEKPVDLPMFNDFVYGQKNNIRVKAVGGADTFAVWSDIIKKEYLATPTNITYDGQYIAWRGPTNAKGYTMYVNGMEYSGLTTPKYLYDSGNQDFEVEIRTEGNGDSVFPSKLSEAQEFIFLGAAENIHVNDEGTLVWDEVEKASSYLVKMKNVNNAITEETLTEPKIDLREGEQTRVQIKPMSNGSATYFSTFSEEQTFALLRSPTLEWDDSFSLTDGSAATALYWNPPTGPIAGYNVKVVFTPADGTAASVRIDSATAGNPSYSYNYLEVGKYEIQVQSLATQGDDWSNSRYSKVLTVIRLAAPNRVADDTFIVSDEMDVTKGFTVNFQGVSGATGYRLWKDGAKTEISAGRGQTSLTVTQVIDGTTTDAVTSHYALQCEGGTQSVSGATVVTLGSLVEDSLAIDITVLAAPSAETLDIVGNAIVWGSVANVSKYVVNTGAGRVETVSTPEYSLKNITTVGDHEIMVCSAGNGRNVLPSNFSKSFSVYKLHKPTNIKIGTYENEGKLSWDYGDTHAQGFRVYVNGGEEAIPNDSIDNMNRYIQDDGVTVIVEATGDYWNSEKTTYYTDSDKSDAKVFKKLAAVTFPSPYINGNNLVWNPPSNVTGSTNISYQVFKDGYLQNQRIDGTSMDLSILEAGTYTYKVRCIGDGVSTINSDESEQITIRRLATPELSRSNTQYVWNGVSNASKYQVYIGEQLMDTFTHTTVSGEYTYTPRFDDLSEQTVRLIAVGSPEAGVMDSKPYEFVQKITKLPAPSFSFSYDKECFAPDGKITVTVTQSHANASGFVYTRNGVSTSSVNTAFSYTTDSATKYEMSVKAVGGTFDEEGMYWADSLASTNQTVTIFASPNVANISINQDGEISGFAIKDVSSYKIIITYSNGLEDNEQIVNKAIYQDENYQYIQTITIIALGNGTTSISSAPVTWTKL